MKKLILFILAVTWTIMSYSQSVLFYNFKNSLNEVKGNGPSLKVLGNEGVFVTDTLNEIGGSDKTVEAVQSSMLNVPCSMLQRPQIAEAVQGAGL